VSPLIAPAPTDGKRKPDVTGYYACDGLVYLISSPANVQRSTEPQKYYFFILFFKLLNRADTFHMDASPLDTIFLLLRAT
jgi:hypothetical protein